MEDKNATITIQADQLRGLKLAIVRNGFDPVPLLALNQAVHDGLRAGDKIVIEIQNDDEYDQRLAEQQRLADLDAEAAARIASQPQGGPDLTGKTGMTLDEGLRLADRTQPDVDAPQGTTTAVTDATSTTTTAAPDSAPSDGQAVEGKAQVTRRSTKG